MLEEERTRQRIADVLATPEMATALNEFWRSLPKGVVDGLAADGMTAHVARLVENLTRAVVLAIGRSMGDFGPAADAFEARADRFAASITASVARSLATEIRQSIAPALHEAIVDDLGPAMGEVMQQNVAPGIAGIMSSPNVQAAISETTREVAKQAVFGSNEALAELAEKKQRQGGLVPIGAFFATRTWLLALLAAAVVFAIPLIWLLWERRHATRYRHEAERRNDRAAVLLSAIERGGDRGLSENVLALLREQLLGTDAARAPDEPAPDSRGSNVPRHA